MKVLVPISYLMFNAMAFSLRESAIRWQLCHAMADFCFVVLFGCMRSVLLPVANLAAIPGSSPPALIFVVRGIIGSLRSIEESMSRISDGKLAFKVRGIERKDEIGAMSRAVQVSKKNALDKVHLEEGAETACTFQAVPRMNAIGRLRPGAAVLRPFRSICSSAQAS